MKYGEFDITTGDYRFTSDGAGKFEAWRKGEPWVAGRQWVEDQQHSKSFIGMMMDLQDLRDAMYLVGKLFTAREIAAALERRGIPVHKIEDGYGFELIKRTIDQAGLGRG